MVAQSITFSEDRGGFLFDADTTKSTVQVPSFFLTDLDKCGADTHISGNYAFTDNYRLLCDAPQVGLQGSYSGLLALSNVATTTMRGANFTVLGTTVTMTLNGLFNDLLSQMAQATAENPTGGPFGGTSVLNSNHPATGTAAAWLARGSSYILRQNSGSRRTIARVERPQVFRYRDNCGVFKGLKGSISASVEGFDLATCKPAILWQASVSLAFAYDLYGTPAIDVVQAANDVTDMKMFGTGSVPDSVNSGTADPQAAAEAAYRTLLGTTISIGVA